MAAPYLVNATYTTMAGEAKGLVTEGGVVLDFVLGVLASIVGGIILEAYFGISIRGVLFRRLLALPRDVAHRFTSL